ncbi:uncharacterized protein LOC115947690 [Geospiza fortis]|uniref:Uncharacterized protein LOC115947690 n=1 Tax=Geospiza fortis TaxID=48883 RepID=A0A8N5EIT5_GEOFO|nr:uncharacterized protein LOC115947690 [Geospiza fortis]
MGRPRKESAGTSSPRPATTASKTAPAVPPPSTSATWAKAAAAGSQSRSTSAAKAATPTQGRGTKADSAQPRSTASRGARGDAGDKSRAPSRSSTTQKVPDAKGAAGPARTDLYPQKKQPGADLSKACDQFLPPVKSQDIPRVEDCGLFIHPEKSWLAASPDGIIKDPATGKDLGLLEVKCPYKHRNKTVREACKDKDFCLEVDGDSYVLKKNHPYFTQVQCQLGTTGLQRADFVVHTNKETAVVPVEFDREFWGKTVPKLEKFYTEAVIPHLEQKAGSSVWAAEE